MSMEIKEERKIAKFLPPGKTLLRDTSVYLFLLAIMILISLTYIRGLASAEEYASIQNEAGEAFREQVVYPLREKLINNYLQGRFIGLPIVLAWCVYMIVRNYMSFYERSKSIYVMKRLRRGSELHVRCLAVPLACAVLACVTALVLLVIYVLLFRNDPLFREYGCVIEWKKLFYFTSF